MKRTRVVLTLFVALGLVASSCGQKDSARRAGEAFDSRTATGGGGSAAATTAPTATTRPSRPDSSVGVTAAEIRIGIHAPISGAGAPPESFRLGYDLYWRALKRRIHGRTVRIFLEDDKYNPSGAVAACKKLVEQDKVFLILGAAGADQLAACAKYADGVGVPYLSEGIAREGFDYGTYFANTPTYAVQGWILAEYIAKVIKAKSVVMVRANTANFDEGEKGLQTAAKANGLDLKVITVPKDASAGEVQSAAVQVCSSKPDVVYPLMSPAIFLQLASGVKAQNCKPRWAGVGNTMGINLVASVACSQGTVDGGASFFSSYPALDEVPKLDPGYRKAYEQLNHKTGDDIGWGLWAAMKSVRTLLDKAGPKLTRQTFIHFLEGKKFAAEVTPGTDFRKSHFGGTGVHVVKVNCKASPPQFETEFSFATGF